jgi:hypothetical protein
MPKMVDAISAAYEKAIGKKARPAQTPGCPGKTLSNDQGDPVMLDKYKSILERYFTTQQRWHLTLEMQPANWLHTYPIQMKNIGKPQRDVLGTYVILNTKD